MLLILLIRITWWILKNFKPNADGADMEIKLGQSDGTYSSIFNYGAYMIMYNGNLHHYGGTNSSKFTPTWSYG